MSFASHILCHIRQSIAWRCAVLALTFSSVWAEGCAVVAQDTEVEKTMAAFLDAAAGRNKQFRMRVVLQVPIDGNPQDVMIDTFRDGESMDVSIVHSQFAVEIRRRQEGTAIGLPKFKVAFIGEGEASQNMDNLGLDGLAARLISLSSEPGQLAPLMLSLPPKTVLDLAKKQLKATLENEGKTIHLAEAKIRVTQPNQVAVSGNGIKMRAGLTTIDRQLPALDDWTGYRVEELDRQEIERTIVRGGRRATEVLAPGKAISSPQFYARQVDNGRFEVVDGQRVVVLTGSPEQIGKAHGELLASEVNQCIDSVLYTFGLYQTVTTGKWFGNELRKAFDRLAPNIPQRFRDENRALALAVEQPPELMDVLNVFPELFHCSGFALFGSATQEGKLYHGRVLDYMTLIGLQHAATTFVIIPDNQIPFVSVGYAGFTGCVTGMNQKKISLGEMGGRGEGQWDGVPMSVLMRMALEQCSSLEEVKELWKASPRTCEYYYVFADGNSNSAVGVAATPDSIEFVAPGETHARLGEGIKDAVVLSEGERLAALRDRVIEKLGAFDADSAIGLMAKPVAMKENLHNVLFVPADGVLYVANADHKSPADERPYVKIDLNEMLALPRGEAE